MRTTLDFIRIDQESLEPKYKQLAEGIVQGITTGKIIKNSILPSLHQCCTMLDVSKSTVEKAYEFLKGKGLVVSVRGKGFSIKA